MNQNPFACTPILQIPGLPTEFIIANDGDTVNFALLNGVLHLDDDDQKNVDIPWNQIFRGTDGVKVLCAQDAVAQVDVITTVTVPNADCCGESVTYSVNIAWTDSDGVKQQRNFPVSFATGSTVTKTQISNALIAAINADPTDFVPVTASLSGETVHLTADTAGQGFVTTVNTGLQTVTTSVHNVPSFGHGDDLIKLGFTTDQGIQDDNEVEYAIVVIQYWLPSSGDSFTFSKFEGQEFIRRREFWLVVEAGGTAEDTILGTTLTSNGGLCEILNGDVAYKLYLGLISAGCPCS